MRTLRHLLRSLALLAFLAPVAATPASATMSATPAELGGDGTIYRLWSGTFGELFGPANNAVPSETPVLALEIVAPGQPMVRHLVPGTEDPATESAAALLYDRNSSSVHVVWNSRTVANLTVSRLELRSFAPTGWTDLIELSGGSLTDKSALRLALTYDEYSMKVDDVATRIPRRVLHLVWVETIAGVAHAYYSPVVFVRGSYLGWNPVVALDELATAEPEGMPAAPVSAVLAAAPTLVATPTGKVTASFIQSQSHHLVAVDVQALPGELGELAEAARGHIVELAHTLGLENRNQLAEAARGHIVELAGDFHPAAAAYLGDRTGALLASADSSNDGAALAEMARGHIVELGREILAAGLANRCAAEELLLEIAPLAPVTPETASPENAFSHYFVMRRTARWEIPSDLVAPDARILVSSDGSRATIAWSAEGHLYYREVAADGVWSPVRDLDLARIPAAEAWDAVTRRASGL